jgi:hypothetical protein
MVSDIVSKELDLRKGHLCVLPFTGITINARGQIVLCCASTIYPVGDLKDIPDLTNFYNGDKMDFYRAEMEEGRIGSLKSCGDCWKKHTEGHRTQMTVVNDTWHYLLARDFDTDWELRKQGKSRPIRFLEYTCSNICNQTCSTCNSFFSSKWRDIEQKFSKEERKLFDRHINAIQSLSEEDIGKIIKILPNLNLVVIKGGEPWADKNNIAILNEALDVNPECTFIIISNMQSISASTYKMLEKVRTNHVKDFRVAASIDGVGRAYDWIRGGSFEKTVRNMEMYYEVTGRKIDLVPFISIQNYFEVEDIIDYFMDKNYVSGISFGNISNLPLYIKVQNLPKVICDRRTEVLKNILPQYKEQMEKAGKFLVYDPLVNDIQPNDPFSIKQLELSIQWIEKMNEVRGFRLQDHVNELQEITEMVARPSDVAWRKWRSLARHWLKR